MRAYFDDRRLVLAPLHLTALKETAQGIVVRTPPDPRTGKTELILDPLALIHRLGQ
jgi:hypothetical protein